MLVETSLLQVLHQQLVLFDQKIAVHDLIGEVVLEGLNDLLAVVAHGLDQLVDGELVDLQGLVVLWHIVWQQVLLDVGGEPRILHDLVDGDSVDRVDNQHSGQQVLGSCAEVVWDCVHTVADLLEQRRDELVVEWETATQHHIQDHTAGPDIHLWPRIQLTTDDLWRSVVW
ncbi:hypothetical protein WICPIJ_008574 [Wickerhamomyces pijperi]|uniref:Uncharacterized protein n=1 Tax=Wickerhamomyces pijperi TaxID=599730 RepID=A0A9P8THF7_WICPI|nr:hypothetical protein WICPIJ_008574 [Wickerhamomyces pijperi]